MHIVIIADHAFINGGQAKVAIDSAIGLAERGRRVTYFAACGPVDPRLAASGAEIICLDQPDITTAKSQARFLAQTLWNTKAAHRLRELLEGLDPLTTIIHVHAWAKALSPSIGPVIRDAHIPSVYTMHEFFLVCPTGGFYDYKKAEPCTRVPLSRSCVTCNCDARSYPRKLLRIVRQLLLDNVSGMKEAIRHVITISDLQYQVVRDYLPPGTIFHRIANPINVPDLGPKPQSGGEFLFVGRLSTEKGVAHFCEAARLAGVVPVIVGDGPLADDLRRRYPEARMFGWQSPQRVRDLMRSARALVFPSVWYEGQPLTVYEALALGTPVIVSDVCAGREAIEHGINGLRFASGDPHSLAAALRSLEDDPTAERMTRAAYENYWADPLTVDRHLDAIEALYGQLLGGISLGPHLTPESARSRAPAAV
ncbi:MAG TPA: glycosyltransferase family 4 protein [Beijerinckiaceae bacterium]|jgi:glycosyltransferase involved in cell wall biosynthesis|nr:glycosyltransferase family 4 protein [Beijerinckiaceae bacterium]